MSSFSFYYIYGKGNNLLYLSELQLEEAGSTYNQKKSLIQKMEVYIAANLDNEQFGVEQLAEMMGFSRSQLHRKLKKINGKSISQFIREYRLHRALELLENDSFSTSEVAQKVGFGSASYFSKCFTDYYGCSPSKVKEYHIDGLAPLHKDLNRHVKNKARSKKYYYLVAGMIVLGIAVTFSFFKLKNAPLDKMPKAVLVMPFKNLSDNTDNQYIAEGMVDAINRHLSTIEELNVLSFAVLDPTKEEIEALKEVSNKYRNTNVLQGSLQQQGNTLRIEVKLLNASSKQQLWAESYDRTSANLLDIQNDIAENITSTLKIKLTPQEQLVIHKRASYDPVAYENFLKGWHHHNLHSSEGHEKSFTYFQKALQIDSTLARAHLGMALYYMSKAAMWRAELPPTEAFSLSRPFLDRALELDPNLYEAYAVKSFELLYNEWDFEGADASFKKGLKSTEPVFFGLYRDFLNIENRHEEAFQMARKVHDNNPYMPNAIMTTPYYYTNRWEEGLEYIDYQLKLGPKTNFTLDGIGFFLLNTEDYGDAVEIFKKALQNEKIRIPRTLAYMGAAYSKKGNPIKAKQLLTELKELKARTDAGSPAWCIAIIFAAQGEHEEAIKWLNIAIDDHEMEVPWLVSEPQFYPLHSLPEFDVLVKRVGFRSHAYPILHKKP